MQTLRAARLRVVSLASCLAFLPLLSPSPAPSADHAAAQPAAKTGKTKSTAKAPAQAPKQKAKAKKRGGAVPTITEEEAHASFDAFTLEWMNKLQRTEEFQRTQRIKLVESQDGVLAEYTGYLPHRYIIVKKTSSKDTPFVGILTYYQQTLRCMGKTREEALKGPFQQTGTSQVSEIFRYTKGKWHY
jgi:hypothetical protein